MYIITCFCNIQYSSKLHVLKIEFRLSVDSHSFSVTFQIGKTQEKDLSLKYKHNNMMCFLACVNAKYGLGYTPVKFCPLILTIFCCTTFAGDTLSLWK